MKSHYSIGIDLGGTKALGCAIDRNGVPRGDPLRLATGRQTGPARALELIGELIDHFELAPDEIDGIGVGIAGLVDRSEGVIHSSVILEGWHDESFADRARDRFGAPTVIDNDVNTAARAEIELHHTESFLFLTVGTGIGGALVFDAALFPGATNLAGEIGHLSIDRYGPVCDCGRRGCVNIYASGTAIERALGIRPGTLPKQLERDPEATWVAIEAGADALGEALASAMNLLNLELVIVGGGIATLGERYRARVEDALRGRAFPEVGATCRVETARGGYEGGAIGAALLARDLSD